MGEYAEMMLDGTCCSQCGEYIGTDNGYPTLCAGCGGDLGEHHDPHKSAYGETRTHQCPHCDRLLRTKMGVQQHIAAKHPESA